jgi:hypothetical protein
MTLTSLQRYLQRHVGMWAWLPAGLYGGASGGMAAAWLLWGLPELIISGLCLIGKIMVIGLVGLVVCVMGCLFVITGQRLYKAIRYLVQPPMVAMYEPQEPIPEFELFANPGCGLSLMVPILLISGALSLPWFWLGPTQVDVVPLLVATFLGLPVGLLIARREVTGGEASST